MCYALSPSYNLTNISLNNFIDNLVRLSEIKHFLLSDISH